MGWWEGSLECTKLLLNLKQNQWHYECKRNATNCAAHYELICSQ